MIRSNNENERVFKLPGKGFLKNFFKVYGPVKTIKGAYFYYYNQLKVRGLSLDPTKDHTVKVNDYEMLIIPNDTGISSELAMFHVHEPITTEIMSSQLTPGMYCLDIGSNIGYYAILESRLVGSGGLVVCVEPSPKNYEYMKLNLERQAKSETLPFNIATGDLDGQINFLVGTKSNLCRVVPESQTSNIPEGYILTKVPIKKVDTLVTELNLRKLDFIRMDPEGYEASIYRGMRQTILRYSPTLLVEFHKNYLGISGTRKLLEIMKSDGYEIKYYIPRWLDNPLIYSMKYAEKPTIDILLEKLEKDLLPAGFNLLLKNLRNDEQKFV